MNLVKIGSKTVVLWVVYLVATMGLDPCYAAVTFTITPSATSNTYTGPLTLNITGLTSGQQVKVQTYLDLNNSGVVATNDPLLDIINLADNQAAVIGGITNVSEPYDSNPASGVITATVNFNLPLESIVGQKIYRVNSNPSGAFTPVTALFDVTNAPTGGLCSGVVFSNGVAPMPYAMVVALTATNQNYTSGTIANAAGQYSLALNPGTYFLIPVLPGFYTDQSLAANVTLTNGASVMNNLVLTNGTVSISGSVYDNVSSNTLGGMFLQAQNNSLFEIGFTDTNGNYAFGATSNNWKIKLSNERLSRRGYLAPQGNALIAQAGSGPVTGANIGLYKGNGLFYGQVTISNVPVPNLTVSCNDNQQLFGSKGYTDANGNYGMVTLVSTNAFGTNAVTWNAQPDTEDQSGGMAGVYDNDIFSSVGNVGFTNNEAILQNFIGFPVSTNITGQLVNNLGQPVSGISIGASATVGTNQLTTANIDTDNNGDFSIGAANGQWNVTANCCGSDGLDNIGYYDPANSHLVNIPPDSPVQIIIYPANLPILAQPGKVTPSQFNLNLYGASGFNYTVVASTNLAFTNSSTITVITNLPGSPYLIQDFTATNSARFYRAFQNP